VPSGELSRNTDTAVNAETSLVWSNDMVRSESDGTGAFDLLSRAKKWKAHRFTAVH